MAKSQEYIIQFHNDLGWCDYRVNNPDEMYVSPNLEMSKKIVDNLRASYDSYKFQIVLRTVIDKVIEG